MLHKRTVAAAMAVLICCLVVLMSVPGADAWSGEGYHSPVTAYPGQTVTLEFDLENTGTSSMDLWSAEMTISWGTFETKRSLISPSSLAPGEERTLTTAFTVPLVSAGIYNGEVAIKAKAVGDLWADTKTWSFTFTVRSVEPLSVTAQATATSGNAPLYSGLDATVSGGVPPYSYYWTLGDGTTSHQSSVGHTYDEEGSYTAKVVVTDSQGRSASDSVFVSVQGGVLDDIGISPAQVGPLMIGVIVALGVIIAAVLIVRRRKAPKE